MMFNSVNRKRLYNIKFHLIIIKMRHKQNIRKFGRDAKHRKAMFR